MIIHEIAVLGQEHGKNSGDKNTPAERRVVTPEHLEELEQIGLRRIHQLVTEKKLLEQPKLLSILYRWKDWSTPEEPHEWAMQQARVDEGLLKLLESALSESNSNVLGSVAVQTHLSLDPKALEPFLPPEEVIDRIRELSTRYDIPERHQLAARQYVKEFGLRERGIAPSSAFYDEE